jgi:hypothetical protein
VGRTGHADRAGEVVGHRSRLHAEGLRERADGATVGRSDRDRTDVGCGHAGRLQRVGPGRLAQRDVVQLAEALLPLLRAVVTRRAPAVDELLGRRAGADQLGQHRPVAVVADEDRRPGITAPGLVGRAGQAGADAGTDHEDRRGAVQREQQRAAGRPDRATHVEGRHAGRQAQRGVHRGRVGLVDVGRLDGREHERPHAGGRRRAEREAGRFDAEGRRVLVERGHRAGALAPATTGHRRDRGPVEPPVRQVGAVAEDAPHAWQCRTRI